MKGVVIDWGKGARTWHQWLDAVTDKPVVGGLPGVPAVPAGGGVTNRVAVAQEPSQVDRNSRLPKIKLTLEIIAIIVTIVSGIVALIWGCK
jgi:hypothetical protein